MSTITGNFINGKVKDNITRNMEVVCPIDGKILSKVVLSTSKNLNEAVEAAKAAFPAWAAKTIKQRVQILYKFRSLLEENLEELTELVYLENGKIRDEARAEVLKGIELTEFACSLPQFINDEVQVVSRGIECRTTHEPMGVMASIVPFNFPAMVPMWTIPNAIALGNCLILKPSEQAPMTSLRLAELFKEAGLEDGIFQVVNGDKEIVEAICDHPGIEGVTFVGSTKVAKIVYKRATSNLKRCISLGGAKNHMFLLPDAKLDMANNIASSFAGSAGQRCMAASVLVAVGDNEKMIEAICEEAKKLVPGTEALGSVISAQAKERIEKYITDAEEAGAKILVDGRNVVIPGKEGGYYVGPTVIDYVTPEMKVGKEEIFGPVLSIIRTDDVNEAIEIENSSPYGNAAAVFTQNGGVADYILNRVSAGMVGVNVGVPVPREPFSFGGWNDSSFGSNDITGKDSIGFWTKLKKRTTKWNAEDWTDWMS